MRILCDNMEGLAACSGLRQVYGKYTPFAKDTLNRNTATMGLHDVFDNGKSQARAAEFPTPPLINSVETLEEPGEVFRGYAASLIGNLDGNFIVIGDYLNRNRTFWFAVLAVLNGIVEKIA